MAEYISREAVMSKCNDIWDNADETTQTGVDTINTIDEITDFIENLPAADVQPVEHGKWEVSHKHIWKKRANGDIDYFAYSEDIHNGVECEKCGDFFCIHCNPNYDEEICEQPHYICSNCGESSREMTPYCSNCGAKMLEKPNLQLLKNAVELIQKAKEIKVDGVRMDGNTK